MKRILIIEDEDKLRKELKLFLQNNGYEVDVLINFNNTVKDSLDSNSDLILLDVNLPGLNGEYVCKEIRKTSNVPIIIVTSKNTEIDEIISMNYGADDFVTKPYNPRILLARIERLLQRKNNDKTTLKYKDFVLDVSKSSILINNMVVDLSKNEFKILYHLLINRGSIVSRDDLMDYLWDNNEFIDDNTLTVNINRLRSKLDDIGYKEVILTKRGLGYIIL